MPLVASSNPTLPPVACVRRRPCGVAWAPGCRSLNSRGLIKLRRSPPLAVTWATRQFGRGCPGPPGRDESRRGRGGDGFAAAGGRGAGLRVKPATVQREGPFRRGVAVASHGAATAASPPPASALRRGRSATRPATRTRRAREREGVGGGERLGATRRKPARKGGEGEGSEGGVGTEAARPVPVSPVPPSAEPRRGEGCGEGASWGGAWASREPGTGRLEREPQRRGRRGGEGAAAEREPRRREPRRRESRGGEEAAAVRVPRRPGEALGRRARLLGDSEPWREAGGLPAARDSEGPG